MVKSNVQQSYVPAPPDQCTDGQYEYDRFNRPALYKHSGVVDGNTITEMTT